MALRKTTTPAENTAAYNPADDIAAAEVMTNKELANAGGQVAVVKANFTDMELRNITTFEQAIALLDDAGHTITSADEELGNGFTLINDKANLVGIPLLLLSWNFNHGESAKGEGFVSVYCMARLPGVSQPAKLIFNDGGTGIYRTLRDYSNATGKTAGLMVKKGLDRSDYTFVDDKGEEASATTYYLSTSA
jgi:hypothetical protein